MCILLLYINKKNKDLKFSHGFSVSKYQYFSVSKYCHFEVKLFNPPWCEPIRNNPRQGIEWQIHKWLQEMDDSPSFARKASEG